MHLGACGMQGNTVYHFSNVQYSEHRKRNEDERHIVKEEEDQLLFPECKRTFLLQPSLQLISAECWSGMEQLKSFLFFPNLRSPIYQSAREYKLKQLSVTKATDDETV